MTLKNSQKPALLSIINIVRTGPSAELQGIDYNTLQFLDRLVL